VGHQRHDEPVFGHHLPVQSSLPHRPLRKADGLPGDRRRSLQQAEDIAIINPYNRVPVLVDRDLVLYESNIINEYIDERFPHPQLMPPDPQTRAKARQLLFTMEHELFSYIDAVEKNLKSADKARMHIRDRLTELAPMFNKQKFLLGEDFSMLDVAIAPLLWRLDHYGIELPKTAAPLMKYAERIFSRQGFIDALTPTEKMMRR
jgi:RNA polymerase-associated protein